ncbi:restriction endonuclease subunit S [Providencia rettgeri]|uniref:restriction endonuclease subunit S n=1 Tax=Providencia sp. PROV142 TaxID=2949852 RepID=UPI000C16FA8A|nr:restriction endonuclease subunit S [Providencia sp. PROV142]EKU6442973.1 restriction endonuclease subunit S [Proteus mirabilis]
MNDFSYVEKLLDGVEVVWFPISEVTERTTNIKWSETSESLQYIDLTSVSVDTKKIIKTTEVKASNAPSRAQKLVKKDDVLFATTRPTQMRYCLIDEEYNGAVASTGYCVLRVKRDMTLPKWILHLISSSDFKKYLEENQSGSAYPAISDAKVKDFSIPIPCPDNPEKSLAIQSEIVRILDKFTALTAELTAELNMRKKQYNYYRDQLLSFEEGDFEWMTLGDVTKKWYSGGTPTAGKPEFYEGGNIPWLRTQEVKFSDVSETEVFITPAALENSSAKWIPENCVIIAISGATAGRTAINKIPLTTNQHCGCLEIDDKKALYRYVFHWVSFNYENIKALGQGARGDLNSTIIKNFRLPVPYANDPEKSLAEQARIVAILDKFDTLTTSLQEGLPREIELRQKQYEYYRDLLLNFPKSHSNEVA